MLDRPNPLGGVRIEGPRLDPALKSFVGLYDIPLVYGLTPGELAQLDQRPLPRQAVPADRRVDAGLDARHGLGGHAAALDSDLAEHPDHRRRARLHARPASWAKSASKAASAARAFQVVSGTGWDTGALARRFNALRIPGRAREPYRYRTDGGTVGGRGL